MFKEKLKLVGVIDIHKIDGVTGKETKIFFPFLLWKILKRFGIDVKIPFVTGTYSLGATFHNVITNTGKAGMAGRLIWDSSEGSTIGQFNELALGIGTTAVDATDTALESEIVDSGLDRAVATLSRVTTDEANDTAKLVHTWTSLTNTKAVTEIGIFNADDIMLSHQVFPSVILVGANNDQFIANYTIQIQ
jgi:hypothetical protein